MWILLQVSKGQEALDKKLGMLETHQKDIHDALVNIENDASRLYLARSPSAALCTVHHEH